jgi:hypothetical protein
MKLCFVEHIWKAKGLILIINNNVSYNFNSSPLRKPLLSFLFIKLS